MDRQIYCTAETAASIVGISILRMDTICETLGWPVVSSHPGKDCGRLWYLVPESALGTIRQAVNEAEQDAVKHLLKKSQRQEV
jgi:hypothetical protein